jgi:hypothetical protein
MKRYDEAIRVTTDALGLPLRLYWRRRLYHVTDIEERWRCTGEWWFHNAGTRRRYYRVVVQAAHNMAASTMQIYQQGSQWILANVYD